MKKGYQRVMNKEYQRVGLCDNMKKELKKGNVILIREFLDYEIPEGTIFKDSMGKEWIMDGEELYEYNDKSDRNTINEYYNLKFLLNENTLEVIKLPIVINNTKSLDEIIKELEELKEKYGGDTPVIKRSTNMEMRGELIPINKLCSIGSVVSVVPDKKRFIDYFVDTSYEEDVFSRNNEEGKTAIILG